MVQLRATRCRNCQTVCKDSRVDNGPALRLSSMYATLRRRPSQATAACGGIFDS